jgi:hypothetical protein
MFPAKSRNRAVSERWSLNERKMGTAVHLKTNAPPCLCDVPGAPSDYTIEHQSDSKTGGRHPKCTVIVFEIGLNIYRDSALEVHEEQVAIEAMG